MSHNTGVCVCVYLLCHGGGEQHGLSVVGTQSDDLLHLFLKVLVQHPEEQTEQVSLPDGVY